MSKRVLRRAKDLGLRGFAAYRARLEASPEEWAKLDELCRIPISRFYRDCAVFDAIRLELLPHLATRALARGDGMLRAWSLGCASGEEAYTLSMVWRLDVGRRFPSLGLRIVATDADDCMVERARRGCYSSGSLKLLPPEWRLLAFRDQGALQCVREEFREGVTFHREDVRTTLPDGPFDLVLCRNVVFTYFEPPLQQTIAERMIDRIVGGGLLVVGSHEAPPHLAALSPLPGVGCAFVREEPAAPGLRPASRSAPPEAEPGAPH